MTAPELSGELRNLIDARLDQIERVLLRVEVSYSERRHIVGEVEAQIFELLSRRSENPTREDVQAVLDSLDPPEAYVPEELRGRFADATSNPRPDPNRPSGPRTSRLAIGSAILAAGPPALGLLVALFAHPRNRDEFGVLSLLCLIAATLSGLVACGRIIYSEGQLRGLPYALFAAGLLPLILVNLSVFGLMIETHGVIPWLLATVGVVYLNYLGIRRFWRWLSGRQMQLAAMLRNALAHVNPAAAEARPT